MRERERERRMMKREVGRGSVDVHPSSKLALERTEKETTTISSNSSPHSRREMSLTTTFP